MQYLFVLPVFNEAENIARLCEDLYSQIPESSFLIWINDGSTDETKTNIKTHCKIPYHLISFPKNQGPGAAFQAGFDYIVSQSFPSETLVITLETDNTSDLSTLSPLLENAGTNDLVLASVYADGGSFDQTNTFRLAVSYLANFAVKLRFGLKQQTLTSFYRVYRLSLLQNIKQCFGAFCHEKGFICKIELLVKANNLKAKIAEVPTTLRSSRRKGVSKMKVLKTGWECVRFCLKEIS